MNRLAASALCSAMLALVVGVASVRAAVAEAGQRPGSASASAVSQPAAKPAAKQVTQAVRKPVKSRVAKQARKARHLASHHAKTHAKALAKHRAAARAAKVAKRKLDRPLSQRTPLVFSPPAAGMPMSSDKLQAWPAQVVIGATVTAFSAQGDVGRAHGIDNGQRAKVRFHGGPEVSCQLMLVPRDREIPPGSTGNALLTCQAPFQVLKDEPTFALYEAGRLVGEGSLSVLSEP
jgi:hypothetical protein